jgi:hypothetical protein
MHHIQSTHIAAILKLTAQQLEALRTRPEIQKEYNPRFERENKTGDRSEEGSPAAPYSAPAKRLKRDNSTRSLRCEARARNCSLAFSLVDPCGHSAVQVCVGAVNKCRECSMACSASWCRLDRLWAGLAIPSEAKPVGRPAARPD